MEVKTISTKKGNRSVTEYTNLLKGLWQEFDHYHCIKMERSEDAGMLKNSTEEDYANDVFAGLNIEFDQIWVQILGKEELPSLNEEISLTVTEEPRRG